MSATIKQEQWQVLVTERGGYRYNAANIMDMIKLQKIKLKARVLDKCHKIVVVACGYRLQFDAPETNFKKNSCHWRNPNNSIIKFVVLH